MKKIYTIMIICALATLSVFSQNRQCEIPLMIFVPEQAEDIPHAAERYLTNKLTRVVTDNGLAASEGYAQFLITTEFSVLNKNILPGPPRSMIYEFDLSLIIGDYVGQKIFSTTGLTIKGVGENETKAYMDAIKRINPRDRAVQSFIAEGKDKIIDYYDNNYQTIIRKAQSLATQKQFEEAMFQVMSIPECSKGYTQGLAAAEKIYQQYVDDMCNRYLAKARSVWAAQQNRSGAEEAGEYLAYIYPDAACYKEAMALNQEIKSRIGEEWTFVMKYYNDQVSLEKQRINAWKEVGVAYGKGQPARTTTILWGR